MNSVRPSLSLYLRPAVPDRVASQVERTEGRAPAHAIRQMRGAGRRDRTVVERQDGEVAGRQALPSPSAPLFPIRFPEPFDVSDTHSELLFPCHGNLSLLNSSQEHHPHHRPSHLPRFPDIYIYIFHIFG